MDHLAMNGALKFAEKRLLELLGKPAVSDMAGSRRRVTGIRWGVWISVAACLAIGARKAVPYHWGDIVGTETDAQAFVDATADCDSHLLRPGESISV